MTQHLLRMGGKRLRPALVLLAGEFGDFNQPRLLKAAAALELIHVASLYHDDIVDRARTRRGARSANAVWGNESATLAGTFLFARATRLFAQLGEDVNRTASWAVSEVCAGELAEVENGYNLDLDEAGHLEILRRKTASLFELPCAIGARIAEAEPDRVNALTRFGGHLGLAFQVSDDALDLVGDPAALGKPAGADLREGVYGIAVLHATRQQGAGRDRLIDLLGLVSPSESELLEARDRIVALGGLDAALAIARREQAMARSALVDLPDSAARDSLDNLATLVLERQS